MSSVSSRRLCRTSNVEPEDEGVNLNILVGGHRRRSLADNKLASVDRIPFELYKRMGDSG
jgi:hypothetical protein